MRHYPGVESPKRRIFFCEKCGNEKKYHAKNMCSACYADIRNKKRAAGKKMFI